MYKDLVLPLMIVGANTARFEMFIQEKLRSCKYNDDRLSKDYEQGREHAFEEILDEYRKLLTGMQIL